MNARLYDIHGVRLEIAAEDPIVDAAVFGRLRHFVADGGAPPSIRIAYRAAGSLAASGTPGRPVYDPPTGSVTFDDEDDVLHIEHAGVRARCEAARGQAIVAGPADDPWLLSRPMLTFPMLELLKRHGRFSLHAAGAALDGQPVLAAGTSGAGKSTLAVALMRAGFEFLADDMVFLTREPSLLVHPFPDETDLTDESAGFFPELEHLVGHVPEGWPKHHLRVDVTFGAAIAAPAAPALIVFPRPSGRSRSVVTPMAPHEVLRELAPNVLLTERTASQAHLDVLGELARGTPAYRLATGHDLQEAAETVAALL
jgi:hypothetical protein